jgi:CDGSH-type Zn-finger protein
MTINTVNEYCHLKGTGMKIKSLANGPNMVETDERLVATTGGGEQPVRSPFYLCRCGQSKNKPFCDGAHLAAKFEAPASEIAPEKK